MTKRFFYLIVLIISSAKMQAQVSIIGAASPSGDWVTDHNLVESSTGIWTGTYLLSANEIKFRLNGSWTSNWGGTAWPGGAAAAGGANINVAQAGNYAITLNLNNLTYVFTFLPSNVGINTTSPTQRLDVNGKIKLGDDSNAPSAGTVRWNDAAKDFEGYDGTQWRSLTKDRTSTWGNNNNSLNENNKLTASDGTANDMFGYSVSISGDYAIVGASGERAAYIFVRSGTIWSQQAKLTPSGASGSNFFGGSVSINGDYAVVGSYQDGPIAQGSAYVFVRSGTTWTQQAKLAASDGAADDRFGISVSISGDYAIVGAQGDDIGVNNGQGSAYVFVRSGTTWTQQAKLTASDGAVNDWFGNSVSISGDYVIVGANLDDVGSFINQGSAYVFVRVGTSWSQQAKLTATDGAESDNFGYSVVNSGDYVIVGANNDDIGSSIDQGSAYVFIRSGTSWSQQSKLAAAGGAAGNNFGSSVCISGGYVIVGARESAFIFFWSGTSWAQEAKLAASDGTSGDFFGNSVSISGDYVIVGAYADDIGSNTDQGSGYLFKKN